MIFVSKTFIVVIKPAVKNGSLTEDAKISAKPTSKIQLKCVPTK